MTKLRPATDDDVKQAVAADAKTKAQRRKEAIETAGAVLVIVGIAEAVVLGALGIATMTRVLRRPDER